MGAHNGETCDSGCEFDPQEVADLTRLKDVLDPQYDVIGKRRKKVRDRLLDIALHHGREDRHGHRHLDGVYARRSVRTFFDEEAAFRLAEERGITDQVVVTEVHRHVDQDRLWRCQQLGIGDITAEDIEALILSDTTYALWGTRHD